MQKSILYLGDTSLDAAAAYLAGVLHAHGIGFNYLASDQKFPQQLLTDNLAAVIISDYPARNFSSEELDLLAARVAAGLGLLMIGGWESFTGAVGGYNRTVLSDVLPVIMQDRDDRVNCPQPCLIEKAADHKILDSLPIEKCPPGIGGFNRFTAKPGSQTILLARRFSVAFEDGSFRLAPCTQPDPLLVIGSHGKARVCVFASDVAPHWVGGLVDWGDARLSAQAPGAGAIEVGNWYATLLANIVNWTSRKS
jgi:uncharacterized membrane protein